MNDPQLNGGDKKKKIRKGELKKTNRMRVDDNEIRTIGTQKKGKYDAAERRIQEEI